MEEEEIYGTYSKIDKVFANIHFHTNCPHACADILNHSTSDHCPILIKLSNMGREMTKKKKIPFRYNNGWNECNGYNVVVSAWNINPTGNQLFKFLCKMKNIKRNLKEWNKGRTSMHNLIENLRVVNNAT